MMQNKPKEIAFVELAADVLKMSRQEKLFFIRLVDEYNSEFSGKLWEKIISKVGNIKLVDAAGSDFSDGSEAKTSCASKQPEQKNGKTYYRIKGAITNLAGKLGWIRVAIYNYHKNDIDFFLLPPGHKVKCHFTESSGNRGKAPYTYNRQNDTYSNNLELYRVRNLKEVCKRKKL